MWQLSVGKEATEQQFKDAAFTAELPCMQAEASVPATLQE